MPETPVTPSGTIELPVRFWQATPTSNPVGHVEEVWKVDLAHTAFVSLHNWNIGSPDGSPSPEEFWVGIGSPQNNEMGGQVVCEEVYPCLQKARALGMEVVHVQSPLVGKKYPERMPPLDAGTHTPDIPERAARSRTLPPVSNHAAERAERVHGPGYNAWSGWEALDFPTPVKPVGDEAVVIETDQFDLWLRERGITTLLYVGFCTNLCILDSPGAMKAMAARGYRCVLFREATIAVEFPDTVVDMTHTNVALRYIEAWVGYTASTRDFLRAEITG
jgi:nicotinamidase-related amidase